MQNKKKSGPKSRTKKPVRTVKKILRGLENTRLSSEILLAATQLGDPRFYIPLWELQWSVAEGRTNASEKSVVMLQRAIRACKWEVSRSTSNLIQDALSSASANRVEEVIGVLQRRGTREVFTAAAELTREGTCEARIFGARILGRLGGVYSPLRFMTIEPLRALAGQRYEQLLDTARTVIGDFGSGIPGKHAAQRAISRLKNCTDSRVRNLANGVLYNLSQAQSISGLMGLLEAHLGMLKLAATRQMELVQRTLPDEDDKFPKAASYLSTKRASENRKKTDGHLLKPSKKTKKPKKRAQLSSPKPVDARLPPGSEKQVHRKFAMGLTAMVASLIAVMMMAPDYRGSLNGMGTGDLQVNWNRPLAIDSFPGATALEVLEHKKTCWWLFHRTNTESAARLVISANNNNSETANYKNLSMVLHEAVNDEQYNGVSLFLNYLGLYDGELASDMIDKVLSESLFWKRDNLVLHIAGADANSFVARKLNGKKTYSPVLSRLTPKVLSSMHSILKDGWVVSDEERLKNHLESILEGKIAQKSKSDGPLAMRR